MRVKNQPDSFWENIPEANICENPKPQREKPGFQYGKNSN
jgi:hypothetical protein